MILDTSALIAILRFEAEAPEFAGIIERAPQPRISAVSYAEAGAVIDANRDPIASRRYDELIEEAQIAIEPVTEAQAHIARQAYRDFGKTSGHPAKLNFGDCFSYALAKTKGEPLLFKGEDFSRTDVKSARAKNLSVAPPTRDRS
jgi:ribonuclease VapC